MANDTVYKMVERWNRMKTFDDQESAYLYPIDDRLWFEGDCLYHQNSESIILMNLTKEREHDWDIVYRRIIIKGNQVRIIVGMMIKD